MSTVKLSILLIGAVILCTSFVMLAILLNPIEANEVVAFEEPVAYLPSTLLKASKGKVLFKAHGNLTSQKQVSLSGLVGGKVIAVAPKCKKGHFVEQDEILYKIDDTEFASRLNELKASLNRIITQWNSSESQLKYLESEKKLSEQSLELALKDFKRIQELTAKDVTAIELLDQTQAKLLAQQSATLNLNKAYDSKRDEIAILKNQQLEIQERIVQATFQLSQTNIRMPFSGVIEKSNMEIGLVAQPGASYVSVYSPLDWEIELFVPAELQAYFTEKTKAEIFFSNAKNLSQVSTFNRMSGTVNSKTRMTGSIFDFHVNGQNNYLMNHLFVSAEIQFEFDKDFILIQKEMIRNGRIFYIENDKVFSENLKDFVDFKHFVVCFDVSKFEKTVVLNPDKLIHDDMKAKALIRE